MDSLKEIFLESLLQEPLTLTGIIIKIGLSLVASLAVYIMYQIFYKSRNIGAGVDRRGARYDHN